MSFPCTIIGFEQLALSRLIDHINQSPDLKLCNSFLTLEEFTNNELGGTVGLIFINMDRSEPKYFQKLIELSILSNIYIIPASSEPIDAVRAFDFNAIDFLFKPYSKDRLVRCLNKCVTSLKISTLNQTKTISIKQGEQYRRIELSQVLYVESLQQFICWHTAIGKFFERQTLKDLECEVSKVGLVRCHRSYIVNTAKITKYTSTRLNILDTELPIGRKYKTLLFDYLNTNMK